MSEERKDKQAWGVTMEIDMTIYADTQEQAERHAKSNHPNGYVTGSWKINE